MDLGIINFLSRYNFRPVIIYGSTIYAIITINTNDRWYSGHFPLHEK